jgi:hypothetical protein
VTRLVSPLGEDSTELPRPCSRRSTLVKSPALLLAAWSNPTDRPQDRTELPLPDSHYSLVNYLSYCLYPPLYIAGPIATFNSFASQLAAPARAITPRLVSCERQGQPAGAPRALACCLN